jgi:hypothetical protein
MRYSYTERDLLVGPPQHYSYSAFEGPQFLAAYVADRLETRARLSAGPPSRRPAAVDLAMPDAAAALTRTDEVLAAVVDILRGGGQRHAAQAWVELFVRKFEVSKRLRRAYGPGFTIADAAPVARISYARVAFAVAALIQDGDLRLLNALLKLNDHVLSGPVEAGEAASLMLTAIDRELELVRGLARRLNVDCTETVDAA